MFKRKQERSQWFEGLLEAENFISSGFKFIVHQERGEGVEITFQKDYTTCIISRNTSADYDFLDGILTYIDHYENNLKKYFRLGVDFRD